MKKNAPVSSTSPNPDRFAEKLATLTESIDELLSRNEKLEDELENLLEENRVLRRKLTQTLLLKDFEDAVDAIKTETGQLPTAPPPAERLYQMLPPSFLFSAFFRIAESTGLTMDEARQCLLHFLAQDLIVQDGSRLVRQAETMQGDK